MEHNAINSGLGIYLKDLESEFGKIPVPRIKKLELLGTFISASLKEFRRADLVFICTHNSRRSQFGQAWAMAAAQYYGINNIRSFSGGTESTAFYPEAVAALQRAGFRVEKKAGYENNPLYLVRSGANSQADTMFSKKYDDPLNPTENFCAILVCSDADKGCPNIPGTAKRIFIPYDDPKIFDGTRQESRKYDERCREIARDLLYTFHFSGVIQITLPQ